MRLNHNLALVALALDGWQQPNEARDPFTCFASPGDMMGDDYLGDDEAGDDYLGDETVGDDYLGDETMGAAARRYQQARRRGRRGGRGRRPQTQMSHPSGSARQPLGTPLHSAPPWRQAAAATGVQEPSELILPFGFRTQDGAFNFTSVLPSKIYISEPQKPVRPERLTSRVIRIGATAAIPILAISDFRVGSDNQLPGSIGEIIDAEAFQSQAFGVRMANNQAIGGIKVTIRVDLVGGVLTAPDQILLVFTMFSRVIQ